MYLSMLKSNIHTKMQRLERKFFISRVDSFFIKKIERSEQQKTLFKYEQKFLNFNLNFIFN